MNFSISWQTPVLSNYKSAWDKEKGVQAYAIV